MRQNPYRKRHEKNRARCTFCETPISRPKEFPEAENGVTAVGGHCQCGAIFVADLTGKGGGEALWEGLTLLCDGDADQAMRLQTGKDYELEHRVYQPRTHGMEPPMKGRAGLARPSLWFFRRLET